MRLRYNLKTVYVKARVVTTDASGGKYGTFPAVTATISADIQAASGSTQAKQYGEQLDRMLNMFYAGAATINQGDGVCVYVASNAAPDYEVIAAKEYPGHKEYVLKAK